MQARVTFQMPDGRTSMAGHGDLVGRLASAAVSIDDARISEAHALISLRGGELCLLALRGRFAIDGQPLDRTVLRAGMRVQFARRVALEVLEVFVPAEVLAIRGPGLPSQTLPNVGSLVMEPQPALIGRYVSGADATIWSTGAAWRYRIGDGPTQSLSAGSSIVLGEHRFDTTLVSTGTTNGAATVQDGRLATPLRLVAMYDTVQIHRDDREVLVLSGLQARILAELAEVGLPVAWHAVAEQLWTGDKHNIRGKWDLTLTRMRRKLRDAGIRQDLVTSDGHGNVQLLLYPEDHCELRR